MDYATLEGMKISKQLTIYTAMLLTLSLSACTNQAAQTHPASPTLPNQTTLQSEATETQTSQAPSSQSLENDKFNEMTIPYLRNREYTSNLAPLQRHADNSSFTSYLTSYQSDSLKINALLTQPKGEKPNKGWPAIVFVHGYIPPNQYKTTEKYVDYVNYLARSGFVVLKIDLRGHGSSDGEPVGGYYSSGYVIDTLNARSALQSADFIDKNNVGLWGHSMAGNITLRSLAAQPDIPAVAIWSGAGFTYTDLSEYRIQDNSYQPPPSDTEPQQKRRELFEKHGKFDPNSEFWKKVVPTNYLSDINGAIGLFHAENDDIVSVKYSQNLNSILENTSIDHQLRTYPSGGHNISGSSFGQAMQDTIDFYKKHLSN